MEKGPFYYETRTTWAGKSRIVLKAPHLPAIAASSPPEFNGERGFWSPEQLLVASVDSCLLATFVAIAEASNLDVQSYRSSARAKLEPRDGKGFHFTQLTIQSVIEVAREQDREKAERLLEKAKKHCFISNALNFPVQVEAEILVGPQPQVLDADLEAA